MTPWEENELRVFVRNVLPVGTRTRMSRAWTKNPENHNKPGVVVGHQKRFIGPIVVHDGQKARHAYHWSFILPEAA